MLAARYFIRFNVVVQLGLIVWMGVLVPAVALPPAEDTPEEVLRTEIITEARSPVDGEPLSAAAYAELQAALSDPANVPATVSPQVRQIIQLLYLRRAIRSIFPFLLR